MPHPAGAHMTPRPHVAKFHMTHPTAGIQAAARCGLQLGKLMSETHRVGPQAGLVTTCMQSIHVMAN